MPACVSLDERPCWCCGFPALGRLLSNCRECTFSACGACVALYGDKLHLIADSDDDDDDGGGDTSDFDEVHEGEGLDEGYDEGGFCEDHLDNFDASSEEIDDGLFCDSWCL